MTLKHLARTAGVAALMAGVSTAAMAQSTNTLRNTQNNWAAVRADLNATVTSVTEDVTATAAAIGNSYSADLGGGTSVTNRQYNRQNVTSDLDFTVEDAVGSISATAAAIANSATINVVADGSSTATNATSGSSQQWSNSFRNVYSNLDIEGADITGVDGLAAEVTAAAIANSLSVSAEGNLDFDNLQVFRGDTRATLNADFADVVGDATFTSAAIANSASFDVTDASRVSITNDQRSGYDPTAITNLTMRNLEGSLESTTAAISNSLSISTLPETAVLINNNSQGNRARTVADSMVEIGNVTGSVALTAAAIANSASITNVTQ